VDPDAQRALLRRRPEAFLPCSRIRLHQAPGLWRLVPSRPAPAAAGSIEVLVDPEPLSMQLPQQPHLYPEPPEHFVGQFQPRVDTNIRQGSKGATSILPGV